MPIGFVVFVLLHIPLCYWFIGMLKKRRAKKAKVCPCPLAMCLSTSCMPHSCSGAYLSQQGLLIAMTTWFILGMSRGSSGGDALYYKAFAWASKGWVAQNTSGRERAGLVEPVLLPVLCSRSVCSCLACGSLLPVRCPAALIAEGASHG